MCAYQPHFNPLKQSSLYEPQKKKKTIWPHGVHVDFVSFSK
jgi:hypothetical protein